MACRCSRLPLWGRLIVLLLSPSGRVARSAERGHDRTLPLQSAIADSFPSAACLCARLPLGGKLSVKQTDEGQFHLPCKKFSNEEAVAFPFKIISRESVAPLIRLAFARHLPPQGEGLISAVSGRFPQKKPGCISYLRIICNPADFCSSSPRVFAKERNTHLEVPMALRRRLTAVLPH